MPQKITELKAIRWLEKNAPHIKLKKWGGKASAVSCFVDKERSVEFSFSFSTVKSKLKKDPSHLFGASKEEVLNKMKRTNIKKYGHSCSLHAAEIKKKTRSTLQQKYNVQHNFQIQYVQNKRVLAFREKQEEIREKRKKTNLARRGVEHPSQCREIKLKKRKISLKKWGADSFFESSYFTKNMKKKALETKKEKGLIFLIEGKTIPELSSEKGCSRSWLGQLYSKNGKDFVLNYSKGTSALHQKMANILKKHDLSFEEEVYISPYYADFLIKDFNLIIECDGLAWHSDLSIKMKHIPKGRRYHYDKKKRYSDCGYDSLFFRSDEINNKIDIIESILLNRINKSKRIFARKAKCDYIEHSLAQDFVEKNHLMGAAPRPGRSYGLTVDGELIALMQVRWKDKKRRILEVSRFCSKLNHSIVGGWSKLIKKSIEKEIPSKIITFVDRRYGSGNYLEALGWSKESEHLSFKWTDLKKTYHRYLFPSNSGYEYGLAKIWDCGQAKWVLETKREKNAPHIKLKK